MTEIENIVSPSHDQNLSDMSISLDNDIISPFGLSLFTRIPRSESDSERALSLPNIPSSVATSSSVSENGTLIGQIRT